MKQKLSYVSPQIKEFIISLENAILGASIFPEVDIEPIDIEPQGDIYSAPMF